jgi:hypothetical protein
MASQERISAKNELALISNFFLQALENELNIETDWISQM